MKPISEVISTVGADVRDVDNWMRRLELASEYEPTTRGRARRFSRANVVELAFIAALVKGGPEASTAAAYARSLLGHYQRGTLREWLAFPVGDPTHGLSFDVLDPEKIRAEFPGAVTLTLVHTGEIARRVDRLFGAEEGA